MNKTVNTNNILDLSNVPPRVAARKVLDHYCGGDVKPPIDIQALSGKLNIPVRQYDMTELEEKVETAIDGFVIKEGSKYGIFTKLWQPKNRERFTIAHELGHVFMHMQSSQDETIISFRSDRSPKETDANIFASEILMPEDQIIELFNTMTFPLLSTFSEKFAVSKQAMSIRLDYLDVRYINA